MKYRDILGYSKSKKKNIKEKSKPKKTVLDGIKQELNEWHHQSPTKKQLKEIGAAPLYKKHIKLIDKHRDQVGRETLKFYELLRKEGLDKAAESLLDSYKKNIINFGKDLKQLVRKII